MKETIQAALSAVEQGHEARALALIEVLLGDRPPDTLTLSDEDMGQAIRRNMEHPSYAVQDWLILARDRLRGDGLVPARLALSTCLNLLEPPR